MALVSDSDALPLVLAANPTCRIRILKHAIEILGERLLAANEHNGALQDRLTQLETDGDAYRLRLHKRRLRREVGSYEH